jgi:tetratricopeptide (TPR) repeat protein
MMRPRVALPAVLACLLIGGCGDTTRGPYSDRAAQPRDIGKAEALYQQALADIHDAAKAQELLRRALDCDLYHGAAHNNLGVLLLREDRLYDAASEFEWARKLMPGHPEPRANLAIALERGGRHVEAIEAARSALEARPGHLGAMKALAMIQIRQGTVDAGTDECLLAIVTRAEEPAWRAWAERQRLRLAAAAPAP